VQSIRRIKRERNAINQKNKKGGEVKLIRRINMEKCNQREVHIDQQSEEPKQIKLKNQYKPNQN